MLKSKHTVTKLSLAAVIFATVGILSESTAHASCGAPFGYPNGAIANEWQRLGGEANLGCPTSIESRDAQGWYQYFGSRIIGYEIGAAKAFLVNGGIRDQWVATGGTAGRHGYPTGNEVNTGAGFQQDFRSGTITCKNGAACQSLFGGFAQEWVRLGGSYGGFPVGWPIGAEFSPSSGLAAQAFEYGGMFWTASSGMWTALNPAVRARGVRINVDANHWISCGGPDVAIILYLNVSGLTPGATAAFNYSTENQVVHLWEGTVDANGRFNNWAEANRIMSLPGCMTSTSMIIKSVHGSPQGWGTISVTDSSGKYGYVTWNP